MSMRDKRFDFLYYSFLSPQQGPEAFCRVDHNDFIQLQYYTCLEVDFAIRLIHAMKLATIARNTKLTVLRRLLAHVHDWNTSLGDCVRSFRHMIRALYLDRVAYK